MVSIPFKHLTTICVRRLLVIKKLGKGQVKNFYCHLIIWRLDKENYNLHGCKNSDTLAHFCVIISKSEKLAKKKYAQHRIHVRVSVFSTTFVYNVFRFDRNLASDTNVTFAQMCGEISEDLHVKWRFLLFNLS